MKSKIVLLVIYTSRIYIDDIITTMSIKGKHKILIVRGGLVGSRLIREQADRLT